MATLNNQCDPESIVAFIEGDLDSETHQLLEGHIAGCQDCSTELQLQQQFMCELESALSGAAELPVPKNFARVVAVRAASDMRGLRETKEHKKALRLCLILALAAFALLGVTSTRAIFSSAGSIVNKALALIGFFAKAVYDAAAGVGVIVRVVSGGIVSNSRYAAFATLLLAAFAVGLLTLLISRYHRTRLSE